VAEAQGGKMTAKQGGGMTPAALEKARRASPEGVAALSAFSPAYTAYRAALDAFDDARDAWMTAHKEKPSTTPP